MAREYFLGMLFSYVDSDNVTIFSYSVQEYVSDSELSSEFIHEEYKKWTVAFRLAVGVDDCNMVYGNVFDSRQDALTEILRVKLILN